MPPKRKPKAPIDNEVENFYENPDIELPQYPNPGLDKHQIKLPAYILINASSGSGKTNMLLNLLKRMDNTFSHIYIVNQEQEPLYDLLQKKIKKGLTITTRINDLPTMSEFAKTKNEQKLIIFDDQLFGKHDTFIKDLFKMGRKVGVSTVFLSQSFYDTDKFIRKQIMYLILLSIGGKRDLDMILRTYGFGDVDDDTLRKIFKSATQKHMDFLKIDVRNRDINRKFSRNFTEFYTIDDVKSDNDEDD